MPSNENGGVPLSEQPSAVHFALQFRGKLKYGSTSVSVEAIIKRCKEMRVSTKLESLNSRIAKER